jgi:hypothetical protein
MAVVTRNVTIRKGKHHPFWWWVPRPCWNIKAIEISVYIDPSMCSGSKNHINKICGFSRGKHHDNSVRLGWSNNGASVGLWEYEYRNGERIKRQLGFASPGKWVKFTLLIPEPANLPKWGFVLNPFHGGNEGYERAVQDVKVKYRYKLIR